MRRSALVLALMLAAVLTAPVTSSDATTAPTTSAASSAPTSWIVTLRAGHDPKTEAPDLVERAGGTVTYVYEHALKGFAFQGSATAAESLRRNPNVRTVIADQAVRIAAETTPPGIRRIRARHPTQPDAQEAGFTGAGVRIGILDTGIDLDHPDLNVDVASGKNCITAGPPEDGHGHGTHVAGIAAARADNGIGVVGVAPGATVVPLKVLDDTGNGEWSNLICAVDYLTGLITDSDPTNDVRVANMSLGDPGSVGTCSDGGIRQAICTSVAAGITYIAAAGNSTVDTATFIPAAFPEVVAVSAIVDLDGEPGGLAGCYFFIYCDDTLAFFSNYGSAVDVTAPGVQVYSTWKNGGYSTADGTSMASPHAAGVAALVVGANPSLSPAAVRDILIGTGEYPDGTFAEGGCGGGGQWSGDPDGITEPLVNALKAAQAAAGGLGGVPTVALTAPTDGAVVSGTSVAFAASASDPDGITSVDFLVDGAVVGSDTSTPYGMTWDATSVADGAHTVRAQATDGASHRACDDAPITVGPNVQGDWVGTYGVDGYVLGAWYGTAGDLAATPNVTPLLVQGGRTSWAASTSDVRALEHPDQGSRRATTWWDNTQLKLRLDFAAAYAGTVHLYALDWDSSTRRQNVTVADGTTTKTVNITTSFNAGAWMHFPISVPGGGSVTITIDRVAGANAVLSGIFLGGAGTPPPPPPPPPPAYEQGVQGDWVGSYGSQGYVLAAWNKTSDVVSLPVASLTLEQGGRTRWATGSADPRALENATQTERRAATYWHKTQVRVRLTFPSAYTGSLHLYLLDWDSTTRREIITVTDAAGPHAVAITSSFRDGAWVHVPISVAAGGAVLVTVDRTAGANAVLSGLFLGGN